MAYITKIETDVDFDVEVGEYGDGYVDQFNDGGVYVQLGWTAGGFPELIVECENKIVFDAWVDHHPEIARLVTE
jgi:hypothetical protein